MNCKETKKRWTAQETEYIQQNLGKLSLEAMAAHLNRSSMSVRLYVLRKRISPKTAIKRNILMQMLKTKFRHPEDFSPTRAFYQETNINYIAGGTYTTDENLLQLRNTLQWQITWA